MAGASGTERTLGHTGSRRLFARLPLTGRPTTERLGALRTIAGRWRALAERHRRLAFLAPAALAMAAYAALACVAFWPVQPLSNSAIPVCACGDQAQEVWFLAWTAHAIAHGANPLFSAAINYPRGVNLADNTSMPLLGLLASPVSLGLGPIAAYNLLMRLAFFLSASSMLLCAKHFVRSWGPAVAAGALYGFSPYMVGQGNGHLFLLFVPLPPVILLICWELLAEPSHPPASVRRAGVLLGLACLAQYLISQEVLVTTAICAAAGAVLAAARRPRLVAERLSHAAPGFGFALAVFLPLVAYPAWYFLDGPQHVVGPVHVVSALTPFRVDLLGPIVPTTEQRLAPAHLAAFGSRAVAGYVAENGIYLGIPLLVLVLAVLWARRREALVALAGLLALFAFVLALGSPLTVANHATSIPLPFVLFRKVSLLAGILAARFSLYVDLSVAVLLALGLDALLHPRPRLATEGAAVGHRRHSPRRRAMAEPIGGRGPQGAKGLLRRLSRPVSPALFTGCVAAVVVLPLVPSFPYSSQVAQIPPYFTSAAVRQIPPGSVVLTYPYDAPPWNNAMLWQAASGMRFRIVGGEATRPTRGGRRGTSAIYPLAPRVVYDLFVSARAGRDSPWPPPPLDQATVSGIRLFMTRWRIGTVVLDPAIGYATPVAVSELTAALGPPVEVGGVDVWYHADRRAGRR